MSGAFALRILDVTRLASRVGRGPLTGVDRVELAYLRHLRNSSVPLMLLLNAGLGHALLPAAAAEVLETHLASPVRGGVSFARIAALRALWRVAAHRTGHWGLGRMIAGLAPVTASYLNVGHSNLSARSLGALAAVPGLQVAVMLHDTIPLDHPDWSRRGVPARFRGKLDAVARHADLVICNSRVTEADVCRHLRRPVETLVAPLGVDLAAPDPQAVPPLPLDRPFFITLGTIEPRKNHALLLDVWARFHATMPPDQVPLLLIIGRRGWRNAGVFERLESEPFMGKSVHELPGLTDGAVAALMTRSRALLFPSRAEGFGLPALEAAGRGIPVICADLPVHRETLGDFPIYADPDDAYSWALRITALQNDAAGSGGAEAGQRPDVSVPTWAGHFDRVLARA